ncbi:hypothetical protein O3P69_003306 [Scylla paramamosain]|uniref:Rab32 n=1 Tax=Scylla paramamosain TaxID=85552 RepID=A0AAW0UNU5_SCYPA
MSTRSTRSATVVEGVPATGRYSDGAAAPRGSRHVVVPPLLYDQQTPPNEAVDEAPTSDTLDEDTYLKLCENLKGLKLGDTGLSDSFDESLERESNTTGTQDSDTESFYSVQSHRTEWGADSCVSFVPSDSNSESTLYDSAQSLQSTLPARRSPFHFVVGKEERGYKEHRSSLNILPGQLYVSDALVEYTSCPDLSPLEQYYRATTGSLSPPPAPALTGIVTRGTMSSLDGAASPKSPRSPKIGEEGEKKKKGLMSSFRKSRKTGRKLRQQKKSAEVDAASTSTGVNSDGEVFDSEPSAPNSPACAKNTAVGSHGDGEDTDDPSVVPDSHERLNGSASSPTPAKSTKVEEGVKKGEEKEEKKRERSKFGSFLRKEKKTKADSASKSSLVSNNSAASSQGTDPSQASADGVSTSDSAELKQEEKEDTAKNNSEQTATGDDSNREPAGATPTPTDTAARAEARGSSFRPYSSSVQFVRNFTVNTNMPKDEKAVETKPEPGPDTTVEADKTVESADVKKSVKPASTEVTFTFTTSVTTASEQTESSQLQQASSLKPIKVMTTPPAPTRTVVRPSGGRTASTSSARSRSPTPLPNRRLSLENVSLSSAPKPLPIERPISLSSRHAVPPPLTITPPEEEAAPPTRSAGAMAAPAARPAANPAAAPVQTAVAALATPPSSPEGHAKDARETPEGDRLEGERNPLLDAPGLSSDSWTNSSIDKREHLYKILVIGELGTGKTSIIKRYVHQFFSQHYRATIGVDFALKVLNWDNNTVIRLQLWDIAGQERFGNMTRVYYKEAVGAFVVFDVTRSQTFDAVTKWKTDLDTKVTLADGSPIPTVLLANKCDQPKEGVVNNPARMDDYCRERGFSGWFETSAKENINIDEASRFLVNRILNNEKQGMMMTESLDADKFSVDGKANQVDKGGCLC